MERARGAQTSEIEAQADDGLGDLGADTDQYDLGAIADLSNWGRIAL
jgi:hypothetical protein